MYPSALARCAKKLFIPFVFMLAFFASNTNAAVCSYAISEEWGAGFKVTVTINNNSNTAINGWSVNWKYTKNSVKNFWRAAVSGAGTYTATNLSHNGSIPAGSSTTFGFNADKNGGAVEQPAITGAVCGTSQPTSSNASSSKAASSNAASSKASSSKASSSAQPSITWKHCANEKQICAFEGSTTVRYGAGSSWATKTIQSSTLCANSVFGDPIVGTAKTCQVPSSVVLAAASSASSASSKTSSSSSSRKLVLLSKAVELSRSTVDAKSYSALGVPSDPGHSYPGALGGNIVSYRDFQYVIYYQSNGKVTIARRDLKASTIRWEKSELQGYTVTTKDRHNKMVIAISEGDGVIHIAFDHHTTDEMHYASTKVNVASNPKNVVWNNDTFTYKKNLNQDSAFSGPFAARTVTYPNLSKISDTVMMSWRSGGQGQGRVNLAIYDTATQKWNIRSGITSESGTFRDGSYTSDSRGPYTAGIQLDANNHMHMAWLWREQSGDIPGVTYRNHGLYYAMSKDMGKTWLDTTGRTIGTGTGMNIGNTKTVWDIPMVLDPRNSDIDSRIVPETQEFEVYVSQERSLTDGKRVTYTYKRAVDGSWSRKEEARTPGGIGVDLPTGAPVGPAQEWDYSRLYTDGLVSVVWQAEPQSAGQATPLVVIDYQFAK